MNWNKLLRYLSCFFIALFSLAVPHLCLADNVEMADAMRSNGKIYVVIAVVLTIFAGILIYIYFTERKLRKLEHEIEKIKKES